MSYGHLITMYEIWNFKYTCVGYKININTNLLWGFPGSSDGKETACNAGDSGSIPGSGRALGGGHSNPLQYSCMKNPMDRGAWQATQSIRLQRVGLNWSDSAHIQKWG